MENPQKQRLHNNSF